MNFDAVVKTEGRLRQEHADWLFCLLMFALFCCVYGVLIFRFGLLSDEVADGFGEQKLVYIRQNRWFISLWRGWFGHGFLPLVAGLAAGVSIAGALLMQVRLLGVQSFYARCVYGCIYLCCAQTLGHMEFSNQSDVVGVALLLVTFSVRCIRKGGYMSCLVAVLALACSIAVYQVMTVYALVLMVGIWVQDVLQGRGFSVAALFRFAGLGLLGLLVWYAVSKWMQYVFIDEVFVNAVSSYQSQYTNWPIVLGTADVVMQARIILHYVLVVPVRHLLDVKECASSWVYTATLVPLVSLLVISWRTMKWQQAFLVCILLTAVMYLPYVMDVLLLYDMPERVHVAAPLSAAMMWGIFISRSSVANSGRKWVVPLCLAAAVCAMYTGGAKARNQMYIYESAKTELQHMYMRGIETAGRAGLRDCRIVICGKPECGFENNAGSMHMSDAQFRPGNCHSFMLSNTWNARMYIRFLRLHQLEVGSREDVNRHEELLRSMPAWPAVGSVQLVGDEVIIKLSDSYEE